MGPAPVEKTKRSVKNLKSVAKRVSLTDVSQFVLDEQSVIRDPQDVCTRQSGVEERERDRFERGTLFSTFRHHVVVPCRIITIDSGISTHSV